MNSRLKILVGAFAFILLLIGADKLLKMQNIGKLDNDSGESNIMQPSYTKGSNVIEVTSESFEREVLQSDKKVLIDFYATWCGPCQKLSPIIDEVSNEINDIKFVRIDVDQSKNLASKYGVYTIPNLVLIENGEEVGRSIGLISKEKLLEFIGKN